MALAAFLADKSALARMGHPTVAARLEPLIEEGAVATCSIVELEVLYSARSRQDYRDAKRARALAYATVPIDQAVLDRALDVQASLAERGQHRGASLPDLLIAAAAERAGLSVLHYDADYDRIATVTGQTTEWVVPRGSVS